MSSSPNSFLAPDELLPSQLLSDELLSGQLLPDELFSGQVLSYELQPNILLPDELLPNVLLSRTPPLTSSNDLLPDDWRCLFETQPTSSNELFHGGGAFF
jgi:hypothetical protein